MHSLILMLLILVCRVQTDGIFFAVIRQCSNNGTEFYIAVGKPLKLCCYLMEGECRRTTDKDSLSLLPDASSKYHWLKKRMSRVDRCAVMFKAERASVSDSGKYKCYKNNESSLPLMRANVFVLDKPKKPKDIQVIYFEANYTLEVIFNTGEAKRVWDDYYEVRLHQGNSDKVLCNATCLHNSTLCTCYQEKYGLTDKDNVTLTVNVTRPAHLAITSTSVSRNLNLYQHIYPSSVVNLSLRSLNSSAATIQFQLSEETKRHIWFMNSSGRPLRFKISLRVAGGSQNSFLLMTQLKKTVYLLSKRGQQNVAVIFQDLAPNSNYTVAVSSVAGGGESDANFLNFATNKSVPVQPPVPSAFSMVPYSNGTCLLLFWKPLTKVQKGGDNLHYKVQIFGPGHEKLEVNTTKVYLNEKLSVPSHRIKIWAANEVGQSQNYSQISIPDYIGDRDVTTHVNMDRDKAEVYMIFHSNRLIQSFAIHWCASEKSQVCKTLDICKGSLHTQHFNVLETGKLHNFRISLMAACKKFTSESKRKITYIDFESKDDQTAETRTAVANVTETEYRFVNPDNEETGDTCTGKDTESATESVGPKAFFVSIKDNEGRWMGMRPARCYYYNDASTVDIEINPTFDSEKETVLNIQQRCDGPESKSKQFLVKKFEIYSSNNNTCTTIDKLAVVWNDLTTTLSYKLPQGVAHVCVKAIGQFSSFSFSKSIEIPRVTENDQALIIYIFVGVLAFVFIIIGILAFICLCKKCHDREIHFKTLWRQNSYANFTNVTYDAVKSFNVGTIPESITGDSGLESCVNTDNETNGSTSFRAGRTDPTWVNGSCHQSTDSGCPLVDSSHTPPNMHQMLSDRQWENSPLMKDCASADSGLGGKTLNASAGSRLDGGSQEPANISHCWRAQESENCSHGAMSQESANSSHSAMSQESANSSHGAMRQESANSSHSAMSQESANSSHGAMRQESANSSHGAMRQESANSSHSGSTQVTSKSSSSGETDESGDNFSRPDCSDIEGSQDSSGTGNYGPTDQFEFVPPNSSG